MIVNAGYGTFCIKTCTGPGCFIRGNLPAAGAPDSSGSIGQDKKTLSRIGTSGLLHDADPVGRRLVSMILIRGTPRFAGVEWGLIPVGIYGFITCVAFKRFGS